MLRASRSEEGRLKELPQIRPGANMVCEMLNEHTDNRNQIEVHASEVMAQRAGTEGAGTLSGLGSLTTARQGRNGVSNSRSILKEGGSGQMIQEGKKSTDSFLGNNN